MTEADLARYPDGPVAPGGAIDALMDKYPNMYGDLSAGSGAGAISRDMAFGREFLIRRADRLMFGTDFLVARPGSAAIDAVSRGCNCPPTCKPRSFATTPASCWV